MYLFAILLMPNNIMSITHFNWFFTGDNSDIVATDSQKNTVYLLAKQHGVKSPEEFALLLVRHFLKQYRHVAEAHVHIQEYPWKRVNYAKDSNQVDHNHAFVFSPTAVRFCDVLQKRNGMSTKLFFNMYMTYSLIQSDSIVENSWLFACELLMGLSKGVWRMLNDNPVAFGLAGSDDPWLIDWHPRATTHSN